MSIREPIAFLSYVRNDDDHDGGRITRFRERLEGEVRMQTGRPFPIFQDRNDLVWGQKWSERINQTLLDVTFLIPIITPSFFESPACREEFEAFSLKEKLLGLNRLILPVYYLTADQLGDEYDAGDDVMIQTLKERQWTDWRRFRFKDLADEAVAGELAGLAGAIKGAIRDLAAVREAADKPPPKPTPIAPAVDLKPPRLPDIDFRPLVVEELRGENPPRKRGRRVESGPYYAYTKRYDEIVSAEDLIDEAERTRLFKLLEGQANSFRTAYALEIAKFDKRIARITDKQNRAVTVLVDNSGSMRGVPVIATASWLLIIGEILSKHKIAFEFSGFTTRAWKGGMSRELWITDGKPVAPGRLNDLRLIVYKSFSESAISSLQNLGLMMREGVLKENVDGESLIWAYDRLKQIKETKKALIVISDGSPVDDSTLSSNGGLFLQSHLRDVIAAIRSENQIDLSAVGISYDVSHWYGTDSQSSVAEMVGLGVAKQITRAFS